MLISHSVDGDALHVTLHHNVDVNTRVAAAVEIEALVHTHRPSHVTVQVPSGNRRPSHSASSSGGTSPLRVPGRGWPAT